MRVPTPFLDLWEGRGVRASGFHPLCPLDRLPDLYSQFGLRLLVGKGGRGELEWELLAFVLGCLLRRVLLGVLGGLLPRHGDDLALA